MQLPCALSPFPPLDFSYSLMQLDASKLLSKVGMHSQTAAATRIFIMHHTLDKIFSQKNLTKQYTPSLPPPTPPALYHDLKLVRTQVLTHKQRANSKRQSNRKRAKTNMKLTSTVKQIKPLKLNSKNYLLNNIYFNNIYFLISFNTIPKICIWERTEISTRSHHHLGILHRWHASSEDKERLLLTLTCRPNWHQNCQEK